MRAKCDRLPGKVLLAGLLCTTGHAAVIPADNLADMSLEQLANLTITSVSKRPERLADAAAAVFVISNEDIRSSGATSLPEVLRLAPALQVAQISATQYVISARGSNGSTTANKLLVLIDGRSVYTPLFSGVFWDMQDVMLEDIERIEVISGPGGTLWGSNAVNGVINILTRSAKNTQGDLITAVEGAKESSLAARHGGKITVGGGETEVSYRLYAKYFDRQHTELANGSTVDDGAYQRQAGFKVNWVSGSDEFRVFGNVYRGVEGQPQPGSIVLTGVKFDLGAIRTDGANLSARWARTLDHDGKLNAQIYYDRTERIIPPVFADTLDIFDIQIQHSLPHIGMHTLVWGGEYRYGRDSVVNSTYIGFLPGKLNQAWSSLFAQDEIALQDELRLTLGARLERNDYTGNELLPNARLAWKLSPNSLLWTAVSRAVRSPSRLDHDTYVPSTPPFRLAGGPDVRSEIADVYEAGYRGQPAANFTYAISAYRADYDYLRTQELAASRRSVFFANNMEGRTRGLEMSASYQASNAWRLSAGLSLLHEQFTLKPGSTDISSVQGSGRDPAQSWSVRSTLDLPGRWELDTTVRHVSALANPVVPDYTTANVRLGWRPRAGLELSLIGQNLLGGSHAEFSNAATRSEFGRSYSARLTARF